MFFKMLKSDLKQKKGLNIVLFIFITIASILVFVGSVQVYQFFTGNDRNKEVCHISDFLMYTYNSSGNNKEKYQAECDRVLKQNSHVKDYYRKELISIYGQQIDFEFLEETKDDHFQYNYHFLMTQPENQDLLFDSNDQPFYVPNGSVYISEKLRNITFANVGDKVKFITDIGNIYEMEIAGFYKSPYIDSSYWYIFSEADYQLISSECYTYMDLYGINVDEISYSTSEEIQQALLHTVPVDLNVQDFNNSNDYILGYVLSVFLTLISLFLILIIIMTIRFTMIAALKEEEKEIGMMRALGVDSLSFRWLFAAKYIAFAVIGGLLGIIIGFPLSGMLLTMFGANNIHPETGMILIIGIFSVLFIIFIMIAFSLLVMRRINKISVINAIRGENSGESFGKSSVMFLHKRKKMSVPFYLASSDIIKRLKRYAFLFVAYTLGAVIMLFTVNIKNSVISTEFLKYSLYYQTDFSIEFNNEQLLDYAARMTSENKNVWDLVNEDIQAAGIPAYIDNDHYLLQGMLQKENLETHISIYYGKGDISQLPYRPGGTIPKLKDEAAISYVSAQSLGIQLGDTIQISIPTYTQNGLSETYRTEKFKITSYIDIMDSGTPTVILGNEFENRTSNFNKTYLATIINAEGAEKDKVFAQLEELYGADQVLSGQEYVKQILFEYDQLFTLLEYVMGGAVILILVLMTYLYSSIFIAEEKSEIALLKSMGFADYSIKTSHVFRMLILAVISVILGEILLKTAGNFIVSQLMETLGITGFGFLPEYIMSFLLIPIIIIGAVLLTQWLNLKNIKNIAVWNIKDE